MHNYEFEFSIHQRENELSIVSEKSRFYLPLYALEAGFHLPPNEFICEVLNYYGVTPRQLFGASW